MKEIKNNRLPEKSPTVAEIMEFAAQENLEVSMKPNDDNSAKLVTLRDDKNLFYFSFKDFSDVNDRATHITLIDKFEGRFDQSYENGQRSGKLIISSGADNTYRDEDLSKFLKSYKSKGLYERPKR